MTILEDGTTWRTWRTGEQIALLDGHTSSMALVVILRLTQF